MKKLLLTLVSLGMLGCQSYNQSIEPQLENQDTTSVQSKSATKAKYSTAMNDLFFAQSDARRWDISAQLTKVESDFVPENGVTNWTYYFKSPFKTTSYVYQNGFGRESQDYPFGSGMNEFQIKVDSNKAIQKAKEKGLKHFPVRMILESMSRAEWKIDSADGLFRIDAERQ